MWLILQHTEADDFVVATGEYHTVREFLHLAFAEIGVELVWEGEAATEIGKDKKTGVVRVRINEKFYRPTEVVRARCSLVRRAMYANGRSNFWATRRRQRPSSAGRPR